MKSSSMILVLLCAGTLAAAKGASAGDGRIKAPGGAQQFKTPSAGDAVLYLKKAD